ncbi:hypothetical protein DPMN_098426 [Dreissena polymorpha]|uniref:Uncharacterized protein n=1 Tax=Dreissena polymorpha TaxID=45954 RepID=A0A9D4R5G9_DREPO|nr:hypothetical protein DPMN_098426 [Dreissena polymorpha]
MVSQPSTLDFPVSPVGGGCGQGWPRTIISYSEKIAIDAPLADNLDREIVEGTRIARPIDEVAEPVT